jgi:hypothetical protein
MAGPKQKRHTAFCVTCKNTVYPKNARIIPGKDGRPVLIFLCKIVTGSLTVSIDRNMPRFRMWSTSQSIPSRGAHKDNKTKEKGDKEVSQVNEDGLSRSV